jgi:hypothetical protein
VFHRARVSAGIETWPLRDTVITCSRDCITPLYADG